MTVRAPEPGRGQTIARVVVVTVVVAGVWLLLGGATHVLEVVAGLAVGLATGLADASLRRYAGHRPGRAARDWAQHLPSMVAGAYRDCWTLTVSLVRRLRGRSLAGRFRTVPFRVGGDGHDDVGRRTLATYGVTLQPNSYVVGFDRERDEVLVHELAPTRDGPVPSDLRGTG